MSPPTASPVRAPRLAGIDLARCVALFGMFAVHAAPFGLAAVSVVGVQADVFAGRASALFCVLAGLSISLVATRWGAARPGLDRWILVRAAGIGVIGLLLTQLRQDVMPVLFIYGLLFALAVPLRRLSGRQLGVLAGAGAVLMPLLSLAIRRGAGLDPATGGQLPDLGMLAGGAGGWWQFAHLALLDGAYPVLTWSVFFVAGMALGRLDLRRVRTQAGLLAGGVALAAGSLATSALALAHLGPVVDIARGLGLAHGGATAGTTAALIEHGGFSLGTVATRPGLLLTTAHSGAPLELLGNMGSAMAVIGLGLLVAARLPRRALVPFTAAGSMTLTLYTAHVLVLRALSVESWGGQHSGPVTVPMWLGLVFGSLVFATAWKARFGQGPLERLLKRLGDAAARGRGDRVAAASAP